jgi:hypothetical protein
VRFRLVPARTARSVSIIAPRSHQARTTAQQSTEATFSCGYLGRWIAAQAATAGDSKDAAPPGANESRYELRCVVILWELRHTGAGVGPAGGVCWASYASDLRPAGPITASQWRSGVRGGYRRLLLGHQQPDEADYAERQQRH